MKRLNIKNKLKTGTWRGQEGTGKQCEARGKQSHGTGPGEEPWPEALGLWLHTCEMGRL